MNIIISSLIKWEDDKLTKQETLKLFSLLIKTGIAWEIEGRVGFFTRGLIQGGLLSSGGEIL